MRGGSQCSNKHEACDSFGVASSRRLRHSAPVAVSDKKDWVVPRKRGRGRDGVLCEDIEVEGLRAGTRPRTASEPRHIDRGDIRHGRKPWKDMLPVQKRPRISVQEQTLRSPRAIDLAAH
jgi:hypothetical protein